MKPVGILINRAQVAAFWAVMTIISVTYAADAASPGALDSSFGSGGTVITSTRPEVFNVADVVVQPDGKIVAVGSCAGTTVDVCLLRYHSNGSLDPSFGTGGTVLTDFSNGTDFALGAVVLPDGRIVAGGVTQTLAGTSTSIFARYLPNGLLDPS